MTPPDPDALVVGGGPAGLATALLIARTGRSVALVEASDRLGGMAASVEVAGQRVDLGSHRLHPAASPAARTLLDGLLGDDLQVRTRRGRLRVRDRWVGFPLRTGDLLRSLPPAVTARIAVDLAAGTFRRERADTYADVVRARLGPTVLAELHGPYAGKVWGRPPDELAGDLARRRIALRGPVDVASRLGRAARPSGRTFLYPRLGYGQVVDRLAEEAVAAGADLRTGVAPVTVAPGAGPQVVLSDGARVRPGRVFWTAPLPALVATAGGQPSAAAVTHRGVALVYLAVDRPRYLPFDAHYVADPAVAFHRLSEPKNYRDGPDPPGRTVLCAEVACTPGDEVWHATPPQLGEKVRAGLDRLDLPDPGPGAVEVVRLGSVYPVLTPESVASVRALLDWAGGLPGVTLLGRQGLVVADNLHHVLDMAVAAVTCWRADGTWDDAGWAAALARFRDHVVQD